jgi:hypothetical protein
VLLSDILHDISDSLDDWEGQIVKKVPAGCSGGPGLAKPLFDIPFMFVVRSILLREAFGSSSVGINHMSFRGTEGLDAFPSTGVTGNLSSKWHFVGSGWKKNHGPTVEDLNDRR